MVILRGRALLGSAGRGDGPSRFWLPSSGRKVCRYSGYVHYIAAQVGRTRVDFYAMGATKLERKSELARVVGNRSGQDVTGRIKGDV